MPAHDFRLRSELLASGKAVDCVEGTLGVRTIEYDVDRGFLLNGQQVNATGFTLGIGIPVFRYYNSVNLGIDFGQRGTLDKNLVRERYFLFTVSFNLHDIWFIKPLYN